MTEQVRPAATEQVKKVLDEFIEDIGRAADELELYAAEDHCYGAIEFAYRTDVLSDREYDEYSVKAAGAVYAAEKELMAGTICSDMGTTAAAGTTCSDMKEDGTNE